MDKKLDRSFMFKWWAALVISSLIVILATLPPFLPVQWRTGLMFSFSQICHQIPDRSPFINGVQLGVCHRCYGVYLGLPLAVLGFLALYKLRIPSAKLRIMLWLSLSFLMIDWGAPLLNLWHNSGVSRAITGLFFGLTAGFYLVHVLSIQNASPPFNDVK